MSRGQGPPGDGAGAPREGAGGVEAAGGGYDAANISHRTDDVPLYRSVEFHVLNPDDPRRRQSTVRAADAWYAEGTDEAIRARLLDELKFNNRFAAWRIRMLSNDISAALDWTAESRLPSWAELQRLRQYGTEAVA